MTGKISVLSVDDETNLLNLGKMFRERLGGIIVTTASGVTEVIQVRDSGFC